MNGALIANWNSVVPKDGIVFHLGDFCHGSPGAWNRIVCKLQGRIYLILGNHDNYMFFGKLRIMTHGGSSGRPRTTVIKVK